jgi:hypothetical protein
LGIASDEDTDAEGTEPRKGRPARTAPQPQKATQEPQNPPAALVDLADELAAFLAAPAAELAQARISVQRSRVERAFAALEVDLTAALEAFGATLEPVEALGVLNDLGTLARYGAFSVWAQSYLRGLTPPPISV